MPDRMNLREFVGFMRADLEAFEAATVRMQAERAAGFVGERFERRTFDDWLRELAAYRQYVEAEERIRS